MKYINYYEYCREIRALKETKEINKSLKFLLLDFADRHGYDGMICPSNKTISEANCISEKSIDGLLSRARKNKLIKTSPARSDELRIIKLLCPNSGEEIFLTKKSYDKDYLNSLSYVDFLKTNYWVNIRKKILKKYGYKCALCDNVNELNVHHRTYKNHGREHEHLEDLIVLCKECHAKFHDKLDSI